MLPHVLMLFSFQTSNAAVVFGPAWTEGLNVYLGA